MITRRCIDGPLAGKMITMNEESYRYREVIPLTEDELASTVEKKLTFFNYYEYVVHNINKTLVFNGVHKS